jgi:dihydropteroate synthase
LTRAFAGLTLDRPRIVAIVNVTPDSFSDGGDHLDPAQAIDHGLRLAFEGADIVDVGGESTRPGAPPVSDAEELLRVLPVVTALASRGIVVSVDTRRASVARACLDSGARIINDVSALRDDPALLPLVAGRREVGVVLVHRRGRVEEKYAGPDYADVVHEVGDFLTDRAETCVTAGLDARQIAVDPGVGFGKTPAQNLALIAGAGRLAEAVGHPVLVGCSRKGFIGRLTGIKEPARRDPASVWLAVEAVRRGASLVRVHDVAGTRQALAVSAGMR